MALQQGFADPVHDAQGVFRAALEGLSRPALIRSLPTKVAPPPPLTPELAALALALADADTPLWLDPPLAASEAVAAFLRFHTGAPLVSNPAEAVFAIIADPQNAPDFAAFAQGTPDYPDHSTTLILALGHLESGTGHAFSGPGIKGVARLDAAPVPADWQERLGTNHAGFPLGIDLILTAPGRIAGLPRSTRLLQPAEV
ncbi:MAG: phosphonate C-P lyase system protein PhnH [Methylobacterium sp.]|uniref:phosphonate C-P lyase system protein PhnH n=1 Tax=Methylobacterium sp. TaxID=409 RepID=UPI0026013252|nr:phosphonate C-P lyase system protein PhnH [Methylobacterium sp.]MBX9932489.1 phosphonate C-P lyase system protein PhnH [Methylobacterium sp.]